MVYDTVRLWTYAFTRNVILRPFDDLTVPKVVIYTNLAELSQINNGQSELLDG